MINFARSYLTHQNYVTSQLARLQSTCSHLPGSSSAVGAYICYRKPSLYTVVNGDSCGNDNILKENAPAFNKLRTASCVNK